MATRRFTQIKNLQRQRFIWKGDCKYTSSLARVKTIADWYKFFVGFIHCVLAGEKKRKWYLINVNNQVIRYVICIDSLFNDTVLSKANLY